MNKHRVAYATVGCYSAIKWGWNSGTTWTNFEHTVLCDLSQPRNDRYCMIPLECKYLEYVKQVREFFSGWADKDGSGLVPTKTDAFGARVPWGFQGSHSLSSLTA